MRSSNAELVVIGCGMAGIAAALRASELDRSVVVLEKAPERRRGGQTRFSESFRVPSADADLEEYGYEFAVDDYSPEDFYEDVMDRTGGRADSDLARTLVENAGETVEWLTDRGVEWDMRPLAVGYVAGRTWFDAPSAIATLLGRAEENGAEIFYDAEATELVLDDRGAIDAVEAAVGDERVRFDCRAAVLASGGYESSVEKRARYYGPGYDDMKVRGSRYNTGEAIEMALEAGAKAAGQWSGAHMAIIDADAPAVEGGANRVDGYQYGVILNVNGERFLDEGEDARAHTYAKFGREVFDQPDRRAYVVLDSDLHRHVRATGPSEPVTAETLEDLIRRIDVDEESALETIETYNDACDPAGFDPEVLDGNAAAIDPPKSNWAVPLEEGPFYAYEVTGGITFAFGGVAVTPRAQVLDGRDRVIPGLYAAGNSTGGLFYDNYPGGTGLTNAAVYGKIAAEEADAYLAGE